MDVPILREAVGLAGIPAVSTAIGPVLPLHERRVDFVAHLRQLQRRHDGRHRPKYDAEVDLHYPPLLARLMNGRVLQIGRRLIVRCLGPARWPSCRAIVSGGLPINSQPVTGTGVTTSQEPLIWGNDRQGSTGRTQRKSVYRKRLRQCGNFGAGAGYGENCQKGTITAVQLYSARARFAVFWTGHAVPACQQSLLAQRNIVIRKLLVKIKNSLTLTFSMCGQLNSKPGSP